MAAVVPPRGLPQPPQSPSPVPQANQKPAGPAKEEKQPKSAAEKAKEREHRREKVLMELVQTETTFSELIGLLIQYFVIPLSDYKILSNEQHGTLFPQLQVIKNLSDKFLSELKKRRENWDPASSKLSDLFEDFTPFFRMYQGYVNNHEKAVNLMRKLETKKNWIEYMKSVRKDCRGFDLQSLLILPIQRIPRYKLLLSEVLKNTQDSHPDYIDLQNALEKVQTVSTQINERMKEFERRETVKQIERKFTTSVPLLAPARQFIRKGKMWKVCRNKDRLYQFFLFNDQILYASSVPGNKLNLHQQLPIDAAFSVEWLTDDKGKYSQISGRAFQIISTKKSFVVFCDEPNESKVWFDAITKALEEQKSKATSNTPHNSDHRKTQSEVAAVWVPDSFHAECTMDDCHNKFTLLSRRHHCRRCGCLVCGSCSKYKLPNAEGVPQRSCKRCYFKMNDDVLNSSNNNNGNQTQNNNQNISNNNNMNNSMNNSLNNNGMSGGESDSDSDEYGEETTALHKVHFYVETDEFSVDELFNKFGHGVGSFALVPIEQKESEDYRTKLVIYSDHGFEHHFVNLIVKKSGVQFRVQIGKKKKDFSDMNECVKWIAKKTKSILTYGIPRAEVVSRSKVQDWQHEATLQEYDNYPKARALFDYEAEVQGDLTLRAGDTVIILDKENDGGWWTGMIGNRQGLFPSNYVELIDDKQLPLGDKSDEPNDGDVLIARFDYHDGGKEELAFDAGDEIILQAKDETGWWLGKLKKTGVVGWFAPDLIVTNNLDLDNEDEKANDRIPKTSINGTGTNTNNVNNTNGTNKNKWKQKSQKSNTMKKINTQNGASKSPNSKAKPPPKTSLSSSGSKNSATTTPIENETGEYFPYEQLKAKRDLPPFVNQAKLELYLGDEEFADKFQMSRDAFANLPKWKQLNKKKAVGLF